MAGVGRALIVVWRATALGLGAVGAVILGGRALLERDDGARAVASVRDRCAALSELVGASAARLTVTFYHAPLRDVRGPDGQAYVMTSLRPMVRAEPEAVTDEAGALAWRSDETSMRAAALELADCLAGDAAFYESIDMQDAGFMRRVFRARETGARVSVAWGTAVARCPQPTDEGWPQSDCVEIAVASAR